MNHEAAGTAIELHLARFCGPQDIVVRFSNEVSVLPAPLAEAYGRQTRYQNDEGTSEYASGTQVRALIGDAAWAESFKFCFEREPIEKTAAHYRVMMADLTGLSDPAATYLEMYGPFLASDIHSYMVDGQPIVDFVGSYEQLDQHFGQVCDYLNLPFDQPLEVDARADYRNRALPDFPSDKAHYQAIADAFALEAAYFPFMAVDRYEPSGPAVLPMGEAHAALRNGNVQAAAAHAVEALSADRKHAPSWLVAARIHHAAGNEETALAAAKSAFDLDPATPGAALFLSEMLGRTDDGEAAKSILEQALEASPENIMLIDGMARLLGAEGHNELAAKVIEESVRLFDPDSVRAVQRRAEALCLSGKPGDARDLIKERLERDADMAPDIFVPRKAMNAVRAAPVLTAAAETFLAAGDFENGADILMNEALIAADGGEGMTHLISALSRAEHHDATKAVVEWCLPLAPTSLRFYRVALRSLRRAEAPDKVLVRQIRQTVKAMKGGDDDSAEEGGRQAARGGGAG